MKSQNNETEKKTTSLEKKLMSHSHIDFKENVSTKSLDVRPPKLFFFNATELHNRLSTYLNAEDQVYRKNYIIPLNRRLFQPKKKLLYDIKKNNYTLKCDALCKKKNSKFQKAVPCQKTSQDLNYNTKGTPHNDKEILEKRDLSRFMDNVCISKHAALYMKIRERQNLRKKLSKLDKEIDNISKGIGRPLQVRLKLRPIVIDGSNVARAHGNRNGTFSCKGIQISIEFFLQRGHTEVTAFVPQCCKYDSKTTDASILEDLTKKEYVVYTPCRTVQKKNVIPYDDRFIVELASKNGGIILSNDVYRDLVKENVLFKEAVEERLLMYCFVGDLLMVPSDPLGRYGPSLEEFLSFPPESK